MSGNSIKCREECDKLNKRGRFTTRRCQSGGKNASGKFIVQPERRNSRSNSEG